MTFTVLFIALVVLSLTGSLLWVMPSKAEKRLAEIRAYAVTLGLRVTSITAPDLSLEGRIDKKNKIYTAYKLGAPRIKGAPEYILLRTTGESGYGLVDCWRWEKPEYRLTGKQLERLNTALDQMPPWTDLLAILPDGVAIGFDERGGPAQVVEVKTLLERFRDQFFVK
ncbi:hypothetical protein NFC81_07385 [Salinispirillum sp. LH 10-3-1]|uniref:Uncharacterized protein n=1 Tax=Salinispirillum sp. LH 10-3-1 TaxID=2952525 RepID=A0AB38YKD6_9GAMM